MIIFRLIATGITGAVLSVLIKKQRPEIAIAIPIVTAVIILTMCAPYLAAALEGFNNITEISGIDMVHIQTVLKIIGIAYICQFAADICKDAGEGSIASKIELGGKIVIITLSMPIIYDLLELVESIIAA